MQRPWHVPVSAVDVHWRFTFVPPEQNPWQPVEVRPVVLQVKPVLAPPLQRPAQSASCVAVVHGRPGLFPATQALVGRVTLVVAGRSNG